MLGVAAVSALVAVAPASAHKPRFLTPGRPLAIGDGTVSYAAYGRLGCPGDTVELRATLARGATLHAELLIPAEGPEAARAATDLPRLTVIDPTGRVVIGSGDVEQFGAEDRRSLPAALSRIRAWAAQAASPCGPGGS